MINNKIDDFKGNIVEITLLFQSIVGLVIILGILVLLLSSPFENKSKKDKTIIEDVPLKIVTKTDFEYLRGIIANPKSLTEDLSDALELIIKYHGTMHKKLGIRSHPESRAYMHTLFKVCRHKNANKEMIVQFSNALEKLNPDYKKDISDAMMRGLNSRGV